MKQIVRGVWRWSIMGRASGEELEFRGCYPEPCLRNYTCIRESRLPSVFWIDTSMFVMDVDVVT